MSRTSLPIPGGSQRKTQKRQETTVSKQCQWQREPDAKVAHHPVMSQRPQAFEPALAAFKRPQPAPPMPAPQLAKPFPEASMLSKKPFQGSR